MPGIDQKDIEVDLADGILTLEAERHAERDEKNEKQHYHIIERSYGTLLRRFQLPFEANAAKVEACSEAARALSAPSVSKLSRNLFSPISGDICFKLLSISTGGGSGLAACHCTICKMVISVATGWRCTKKCHGRRVGH